MSTGESYKVRFTGITPVIMHCGRTANPLDSFTRAMKPLTSKRGKADDDFEQIAEYEFYAGLYTTPQIKCDDDGNIIIPEHGEMSLLAHLLDSNIRKGAQKHKEGKVAAAACLVEDDAKFFYNGNQTDVPDNWKDFAYVAAVNVSGRKVMRTRPRFDEWSAEFTVYLDHSIAEKRQLETWLESAGRLVGIGDWRPEKSGNFGRYSAEIL